MTAQPDTTAPLISAHDLIAALQDRTQDWLVLDCRFNLADTQAGEAAHAEAHIAGALYAHLDRDLSGPKTGLNGRHPLPTPEAFGRTASRWGITPRTHVVVYDAAGGMFASRLWWMLRWAGHEQVRVLDGGWQAWLAAQGPVDQARASRQASAFEADVKGGQVVSTADVLSHLNRPGSALLIDARAPDRFKGENETIDPVGGHIPGARNRFFQLNLQADGRFKPAHVLQAEFGDLLAGASVDTVVHQCGSGVTACHNLLAMAHAGLAPTRLYAGSWSEWCADPARPVER